MTDSLSIHTAGQLSNELLSVVISAQNRPAHADNSSLLGIDSDSDSEELNGLSRVLFTLA